MKQMTRPRSQQEPRRRMSIRWPYVVLLLLMVLFSVKFIQKTHELQQLTRESTALRIANERTMADNTRTVRHIRYYKTMGYIQEQARAVFGFTLPGEIAIIPAASTAHHPAVRRAPVVVHTVRPLPTWKRWWQSFFG